MQDHKEWPHILSASSNRVGFTFLILPSIRTLNLNNKTLIDNITIYSFPAFMVSSIFSLYSTRTSTRHGMVLGTLAEYALILGLFLVLVAAMLIAFNLIN